MYCPKCKQQVSGDICPVCGYKSAFKKMDDLGGNTMPESLLVEESLPVVSAPSTSHKDKSAVGGFKPMDSLGGEVKKSNESAKKDIPVSDGFKRLDPPNVPNGHNTKGRTKVFASRNGSAIDPDNEKDIKPKNDTKSFNWKRWLPGTASLVAACLLVVLFSTGKNHGKDIKQVNNEISCVENTFLNGQEYIDLEEKDQLLNSVYQAVNEMDEVSYCEKNDYGIYMVLDNGLGMHYQAPIPGLAASGAELQVYAYQPFYDEFVAEKLSFENVNSFNESVVKMGKNGIYPDRAVDKLETLEVTESKARRFYNQEVTLELLKTPKPNSVIVWVGHGGYSKKTHSTLLLTVEYTEALYKKHKDDFDNHRIEIVHSKPTNIICVTPAFFDHYLGADSLDNSIVYLGSCHSGQDDILVSTLISKGAAAVYWNSDAILQHYNNRMCRSVMEALCDGASTGNALAIAQDANGALDNTLFGLVKKNVWVGCSGDQYLTLKDMYNRANRQTAEELSTQPTQPAIAVTTQPTTKPPTEATTVATKPVETLPTQKVELQTVYAAYGALLRDGVWLSCDNGDLEAATHYQLLDMNGDGIPEIIVFAVDMGPPIPVFEIYTYSQNQVVKIADSLNTCDLSCWYNAGHSLCIQGETVAYEVAKGMATYLAGTAGRLEYDGKTVNNVTLEIGEHLHNAAGEGSCELLVQNRDIIGGIEIGSSADFLSAADQKENPYVDTWLSTVDFDGFVYTNEVSLNRDGTAEIYIYDGSGGYEVWDTITGTWEIQKETENTYWIGLQLLYKEISYEPNGNTTGRGYTAVVKIELDGDYATIQLDSGEFPYIFYDYSFTRGEGVFSHN